MQASTIPSKISTVLVVALTVRLLKFKQIWPTRWIEKVDFKDRADSVTRIDASMSLKTKVGRAIAFLVCFRRWSSGSNGFSEVREIEAQV